MLLATLSIFVGLGLLTYSADRFVDGAAATARYAGMPPLLIGIVIIGLGTSAPELVVSVLAALQGNPGLALGNAYGSNIANIGLILGLTALLCPIVVQSQVVRQEMPLLLLVTAVAVFQLVDGHLTRLDGWVLLVLFVVLMGWLIWQGLRSRGDVLEFQGQLQDEVMSLSRALFWVAFGLLLMVGSSRLLVWGAVEIAHYFGVSDLLIGLTIVAFGTSLPELAAAFTAVRKGEHDLALGNIIGSNLFNTLAVVGLAVVLQPLAVEPEVLTRDAVVMGAMSLGLFVICFRKRGGGAISRKMGGVLLLVYLLYIGRLVAVAIQSAS
ncbi:MAG: calcium/sodium antiporter [Trichloromonadaceae bacterium]